jgi:ribose transport system permease protein
MSQETGAETATPERPANAGGRDDRSPSRASLGVRGWRGTRQFRPVLALLILLTVGFAVSQSSFATWANVQNIFTSVAELWVMAIGMTFVLISGGVDLSVSAIAAFVGIFLAKMLGLGVPGGIAVLLTIALGALVGAGINGTLIGKLGMSFFVVTLASMIALTGVVSVWTGTQSYYVSSPIITDIAINHVLGVPTPLLVMLALLAVAGFVQRRTYFGRDVYAVGGSVIAARLSGIRTSRTLVAVYALSGACAALGGVIAVGRIGAASPQVDSTLPLQAIAAVLLGGTSLTGGAGGVLGSALGCLFIGVLQNGLSIAGVPSFWQQVVTGAILALAVLGDREKTGGGRRSWLRTALSGSRRTSDTAVSDTTVAQ